MPLQTVGAIAVPQGKDMGKNGRGFFGFLKGSPKENPPDLGFRAIFTPNREIGNPSGATEDPAN